MRALVFALLWLEVTTAPAAGGLPLPVSRVRKELRGAAVAKERAASCRHLDEALAQLPNRHAGASLVRRLRETLEKARRSSSVTGRRMLIREAQAQLRSLETVLSLSGSDKQAQGAATRKLREILSRREFRHGDFRDRLMERIALAAIRFTRWLGRHFKLRIGAGAWQVVRVAAYVTGIVALCLAAVLLANTLSSVISRWRGRTGPEGTNGAAPEEDPPRARQRRLLEAASRYAADGDYRQALRCLYQALILTLHLGHVLDYDDHCTNREYLSRLSDMGASALATVFGEATGLFERKWYGCRRVEENDVQSMWKFLRSAERALHEWKPESASRPDPAAA